MSTYAVTDPSTGEVVASSPTVTADDIEAALAGAAAAHADWSRNSTVAERAALVRRVGELHTERREELAEIINRERGKAVDDSRGEVDFCAEIYAFGRARSRPERASRG